MNKENRSVSPGPVPSWADPGLAVLFFQYNIGLKMSGQFRIGRILADQSGFDLR